MGLILRPCEYCDTLVYWNRYDRTLKETGSWYELESRTLHSVKKCHEVTWAKVHSVLAKADPKIYETKEWFKKKPLDEKEKEAKEFLREL